jgi:hypothetical protein
MVLQGAAFSGTIPRDAQRRAIGPCELQPTAALVRYMTYQSIIHGAQGVLYFGNNVGLHPEWQPYGWDWGYWRSAVAPVLRELRSPILAPVLAAAGHPGTDQVKAELVGGETHRGPYVHSRTLAAPDGSSLTIAARRERRRGEPAEMPAYVSVGAPDRAAAAAAQEAEICFGGGSVSVSEGAAVDTLVPWEVRVYRVRPERQRLRRPGAPGGGTTPPIELR